MDIRTVAATAATTLALSLAAGPALAATDEPEPEPEPETVTITVDAQALADLCVRLPKAMDRTDDLLTRIQGDAATAGSAAWVRARAAKAADAGHDDLARRLEFRADQRIGHVDELESLAERLAALDAQVCAQVQP